MKKLAILSLFCLSSLSALLAQEWKPVLGRWEYQFLKIDSLVYLPGGNTAHRPAPVSNSYWIRYNTDSIGFEFSNGMAWIQYAPKAPGDWTFLDSTGTTVRDTTINYAICGTQTVPYYHFSLPQFIGFRVRVYSAGIMLTDDPTFFCTFEQGYYQWISATGDLYLFQAAGQYTVTMVNGF